MALRLGLKGTPAYALLSCEGKLLQKGVAEMWGMALPGRVMDEVEYELAECEDECQVEEQLDWVGGEVLGKFRYVETTHGATLPATRQPTDALPHRGFPRYRC